MESVTFDQLGTLFSFSIQVLLGVDRLDMIKGIPQKLLAYEMFLEKCPEWRERVILVQIAVASRQESGIECKFLNLSFQTIASSHMKKNYVI